MGPWYVSSVRAGSARRASRVDVQAPVVMTMRSDARGQLDGDHMPTRALNRSTQLMGMPSVSAMLNLASIMPAS